MMDSGLKTKAIKGTLWSAIDRLSVQIINFGLSLAIARLLDPSDYGIIAMTMLFITLSNVFVDSGFANALVRKNDRTETDNSTVFYFNIAVGITVYAIMWVVSPLIAKFYNMPLLENVLRVTALVIPLYSFSIVQQAILTINIDFKSQAKISVSAALVSGVVGLIMAYNGAGVWSLTVQMVSAAFIRMIMLWIFVKWKPSQPFSEKSFRELFSFGYKLLLANIVVAISNNITTLIIGKKFSSKQLGFYNRAEQISYFPVSNLTAVLQRVTFPVFSKMQDNTAELRNTYLKIVRLTSILSFLILGVLFVVAEPLIETLLTSKWLPSVGLLQILIIGIVWWPFFALNINILQVVGYSKYVLAIECAKATINLIAIFIAIPFGIEAVCIVLSVTAFVNSFIYTHFTKKAISVSWLNQVKVMLPHVIAALVSVVVAVLVICEVESLWIKIIWGCVMYLAIYVAVLYVIDKSELEVMRATLKDLRHK